MFFLHRVSEGAEEKEEEKQEKSLRLWLQILFRAANTMGIRL